MSIETPTVLAFERKIECSDGFFYQANSDNLSQLSPLKIREKSIRGTISNRLKKAVAESPLKLDAEIQKANLQTVDVATLDDDKDTLIVNFTIKILPFDGSAYICNSVEYQDKLKTILAKACENSIPKLAQRYAYNIANARWLWRNRVNAESIKIIVENPLKNSSVEIEDAKQLSLISFKKSNEQIDTIGKWIEEGFKGEEYTLLKVQALAKMGNGQEVFPSQELILDKGSTKKSKFLYRNEQNKAGLHSQKIGNAIRTVDNWYNNASFPIAVEPYGSVTTMGKAFRQPKDKQDFYSLLDNWLLKDQEPSPAEQKHYVIAMLIRGGVFGGSKKDD